MSLYIAPPGFIHQAVDTLTHNLEEEGDWPLVNMGNGDRHLVTRIIESGTATADLELALPDTLEEDDKAINYYVLTGASTLNVNNLFIANSPSATAFEDSYTDIVTLDVTGLSTFYGPTEEDYFEVLEDSTSSDFWRVYWSNDAGTTITATMGKLYFGQYFDFGVDPHAYDIQKIDRKSLPFVADSGAVYQGRVDFPLYRVRYTWRGVTDAKLEEFYRRVVSRSIHDKFFLMTTDNSHHLLDNHRLLHCELISVENRHEGKTNTVIAEFLQLDGRYSTA